MKKAEKCFKILVIGNSLVGKTKYITRYIDDSFNENYIATIGTEHKDKLVRNGDEIIKLQVWDSVGQERFQIITKNFLHRAHAILLLFDLSDRESFNSVDNWAKQIRSILAYEIPVVLVGNKCDLKDDRQVANEEGIDKAEELKMKYFEASAKDKINVNESFAYLTKYLVDHPLRLDKKENVQINQQNKKEIDNKKQEEKKKCQC